MSELKVHRFVSLDEVWPNANLGSDYYLKSEADKVIAHNKYKRCLVMTEYCYELAKHYRAEYDAEEGFGDCWLKWIRWAKKWHKRWLELAEKFKEAT